MSVPRATVLRYPASALQMVCREVEEFDVHLVRLAQTLADVMITYQGVGLAASQIGVLQRVCAIRETTRENSTRCMVLVNPVIVSRSEETAFGLEGCLSIPGVSLSIERNVSVHVQAHDPKGREVDVEVHDGEARIVQHELDHLDGRVTLDLVPMQVRYEAILALAKNQPFVHTVAA